jgi:hypothetical protein
LNILARLKLVTVACSANFRKRSVSPSLPLGGYGQLSTKWYPPI